MIADLLTVAGETNQAINDAVPGSSFAASDRTVALTNLAVEHDCAFHLLQFDAKSAHLDGVILASEELQTPVGHPAHLIVRSIHPFATARAGDECGSRFVRET